MRTITVSLPLVPLRVGDVVDRSAWVPHLTVLGNARVPDGGTDPVAAVLRAVARAVPLPRVVVGAGALFGPDRTVLVDLVESPGLVSMHTGYPLPERQRPDLELRRRLVTDPGARATPSG